MGPSELNSCLVQFINYQAEYEWDLQALLTVNKKMLKFGSFVIELNTTRCLDGDFDHVITFVIFIV